jgi:hypothetical protein
MAGFCVDDDDDDDDDDDPSSLPKKSRQFCHLFLDPVTQIRSKP